MKTGDFVVALYDLPDRDIKMGTIFRVGYTHTVNRVEIYGLEKDLNGNGGNFWDWKSGREFEHNNIFYVGTYEKQLFSVVQEKGEIKRGDLVDIQGKRLAWYFEEDIKQGTPVTLVWPDSMSLKERVECGLHGRVTSTFSAGDRVFFLKDATEYHSSFHIGTIWHLEDVDEDVDFKKGLILDCWIPLSLVRPSYPSSPTVSLDPNAAMIERDGEEPDEPLLEALSRDGAILTHAIAETSPAATYGGWPYQVNEDCTRFISRNGK